MMNVTKKLTLLLTVLLTLLLTLALAGCGSGSSSGNYSSSASMAASAAPSAAPAVGARMEMARDSAVLSPPEGSGRDIAVTTNDSAPETGGGGPAMASNVDTAPAFVPEQPRKLVKNGQLQLETKEFDTTLESLLRMFEASGGYIDSQSVDGKSLRSDRDYYERSASIIARVPVDKLGSVTEQIGTLCNIVSQSEDVSDITENYYDAQSRLDMLKVKEARLLELVAKAEKLEDIIQLEDALSNCQYQIDSLTGQLRRMDNQVSYSTLQIYLNEVVEYQDMAAPPATFGQKLADSTSRSGRRLLHSMEDTLLGIIENGPVLIFNLAIWGAVIYLIYWLFVRKRLRARKQATAPRPVTVVDPPAPPAPPVE